MDSPGGSWNSSSSNSSSGSDSSKKDKSSRKGSGFSSAGFCPEDSDRAFYSTNNNDYSKYSGSGYGPQATGYSDLNSDHASQAQNPGYSDYKYDPYSTQYNYPGYSDYQNQQYQSQCYSDCTNPQCRRDQSPSNCSESGYSDYGQYSDYSRPEYQPPSRVQVTAKLLFGSVSAISNLKQKKCTKKK
ncbi:uncharacterized protein DDB_G0283357-like [Penaeus japonicus]|uniref:uncharacterized protein DDB_G0283357-like n=1 Tax=Penaeus japonicus TaxID=27405 RepID=UPI001C70E168|nr:uncharacterized protein DDB_G0283357-like [Penaeus japonicus]XP_042872266.1 uncharacterized protein DDB_G0283357-like [Penaeus japonicus]